MANVPFKDLETRGFVHIPAFLSEDEVRLVREDYSAQGVNAGNRNYGLSSPSPALDERMRHRIQDMLELVRSHTDLKVDMALGGAYFATGRGIRFGWHQDHESFFAIQNHYDYLNFYIPILKPRRDKSNLTIVPFDALERDNPKAFRWLVRGGASRFVTLGRRKMVFRDDAGTFHLLRTDLDRIACTPLLDAGDLLLLRGDMIHQTQDTETDRVALSFRAASSATLVRRSRLVAGGLHKAVMMMNNAALYERMFKAFDQSGASEVPMAEYQQILDRIPLTGPEGRRAFVTYLLRQKRREHVFFPFLRSSAATAAATLACLAYVRASRRAAAAPVGAAEEAAHGA